MTIWQEALERQTELVRWMRTPFGSHCVAGFIGDVAKKNDLQEPGATWQNFPYIETDRVKQAPTYVISKEMVDVVEVAYQTMPTEPLLREDLPELSGFMYLEKPLITYDVRGKAVNTRAIVWSGTRQTPQGEGLVKLSALRAGVDPSLMDGALLTFYSDVEVADDYHVTFGELLEEVKDRGLKDVWFPRLSMWYVTPWQLNTAWDIDRSGTVNPASRNPVRFLAAAWRLMQQPLAAVRKEQPNRALRRQAERDKTINVSDVKVVTLRRTAEPTEHTETTGTRSYSHQWLVDGFWRNQPYGPRNSLRRLTWISPHVAGPKDKPLVLKRKVYQWVR